MKLYFMKQKAIDYIKTNMKTLYMGYLKNSTNQWIYDLFEYDPFEYFIDVPDFELTSLDKPIGQVELENCKIIYSNLRNVSESQASDERLWAGLCNGVFYDYVRKRWGYPTLISKNPKNDSTTAVSRFFFSGGGRGGLYRNTLAKCWWVGESTYELGVSEHWRMLDTIGAEDFSTRVSDIFYSNTFAASPEILRGICKGLKYYRDRNIYLKQKEHIRPTMKYLNALGGGILLDALSSDDIASIVIENIEHLRNGEQGDFFKEQMQDDEVLDEDE